MVNYSNAEMAEMHYVYGLADGNGEQARRIYHERYRALIVEPFLICIVVLLKLAVSEEVHLKVDL